MLGLREKSSGYKRQVNALHYSRSSRVYWSCNRWRIHCNYVFAVPNREVVGTEPDVIALVQNALVGLIGIIGGYFGAKATKGDE
jgi:hypothetical protein